MKITNPHSIAYTFGEVVLKPGPNDGTELTNVSPEVLQSMRDAGMTVEVPRKAKQAEAQAPAAPLTELGTVPAATTQPSTGPGPSPAAAASSPPPKPGTSGTPATPLTNPNKGKSEPGIP
jgi:hypothetical protein